MKKSFRCFLRTLSPIHVGCDEVYEPMGFVVNEDAKQMIVFGPLSFIGQLELEDRKEFSAICAKGTISSILEIYKFLKGRKATGRRIDICQGFVDHYRETLSIPVHDTRKVQQELSRFTIERTSFYPGNHRPYIPGSAVKGVLRTAYLNSRAKVKPLPSPRGKSAAKDLEKALLDGGAFETDPFRMLKVSDFKPVGQIKTRVIYAVNEKKRPSKFEARGPYQILEVIQPGAVFEGEIAVDKPQTEYSVKASFSLNELLESTARFYTKEKNREDSELSQIKIPVVQVPDNEDRFLIRLGRHSGAESVTIEGHRSIRIMTGRGQRDRYESHATTLWLASEEPKPKTKQDLHPFGWAQLGELSASMDETFKEEEKVWKEKAETDRMERQAEIRRYGEQQLQREHKTTENSRRKALEEKQDQEEMERRKAELEAMSPEQREIAALCDPSITENQAVEIYGRVDEFIQENKKSLAQALKDYWMAHGKWKTRDCSKKQWQKVQKVKGILEEK